MSGDDFIFDLSTDKSFSYCELLDIINRSKSYNETGLFKDFSDFISNLLIAIVNERNITLVDKDFSDNELNNLDLTNRIFVKNRLSECPVMIDDNLSLVDKVFNSRSLITFFTSGTTGLPKKIVHNISTLTRMVRRGENYKDNIWAIAYNPTHMAGMQVILQALANNNKMVYIFETKGDKVKAVFNERRITHISATPSFYRLLLSDKDIFPSVRRVTLGGEKSDSKIYKKITLSFPNARINNIYASTELGSLFVSEGNVFKVPDELQSKIKVIENELLVHSSLLGWDYKDEWYNTGDLVDLLTEFPITFRFRSRMNEMINVGGYKVNPWDVEDKIREFPEVLEARVFGKPNSVLGNILCAEIVLNYQTDLEIAEIRERLKSCLQDYKIPRIIKFIDKIEVTRTGKLSRI